MKLIILTQYYPPEIGAAQNRLSALARSLRDRGHEVTVLTAFPNYPVGRVKEEYHGHFYTLKVEDGIEVIRTWITPRPGNSWFARGLTYLSFAFSSLGNGCLRLRKADVLLWETPPLTLGPTAYLLSRLKGARLVTNVSDLWPASLETMGILNEGIVLTLLRQLEEFVYRRSSLISGQTEFITRDIGARIPNTPTILWRNGVDAKTFVSANGREWRDRWKVLQDRFVVGYAGLLGMTQGLDVIVRSAAILRDAPVTFVFVGDGPGRNLLISLANELRLEDFIVAPPCSDEEMPDVWSSFDCAGHRYGYRETAGRSESEVGSWTQRENSGADPLQSTNAEPAFY
ncbi:MAG: glycosyltransferase family 4 protein [candidate division Zixibacteria bacterium]|nr:glycosyltransferase family 4 protein [candidate division Zixibacteria bacterium]